jgi:hypothetical protein
VTTTIPPPLSYSESKSQKPNERECSVKIINTSQCLVQDLLQDRLTIDLLQDRVTVGDVNRSSRPSSDQLGVGFSEMNLGDLEISEFL